MTNCSQDIIKEQFQQQLTLQPHKQTLLRNRYMKEICITLMLKRNMLSKNALLRENFIKLFQTSDFIIKLMTTRQFCN